MRNWGGTGKPVPYGDSTKVTRLVTVGGGEGGAAVYVSLFSFDFIKNFQSMVRVICPTHRIMFGFLR